LVALAEMYVQGVSTRKVKAITEELTAYSFSASAISVINKGLDATVAKFAHRPAEEAYPYLIVDARYEKVRESGVIRSQAVLIAIGHQLGRSSASAGRRTGEPREPVELEGVLAGPEKARALRGGVRRLGRSCGPEKAIRKVLPEAAWQRCYVHFLRNALDYLPRKVDDDCLQELRWMYDRRDFQEARRAIASSVLTHASLAVYSEHSSSGLHKSKRAVRTRGMLRECPNATTSPSLTRCKRRLPTAIVRSGCSASVWSAK
jgi:putative transposase